MDFTFFPAKQNGERAALPLGNFAAVERRGG